MEGGEKWYDVTGESRESEKKRNKKRSRDMRIQY